MNDFENKVLSVLSEIQGNFSKMQSDINNLREEMNQNFDVVKEEMEITRTAANYNGEKLEELISELKATRTIE